MRLIPGLSHSPRMHRHIRVRLASVKIALRLVFTPPGCRLPNERIAEYCGTTDSNACHNHAAESAQTAFPML